MAATSPSRAYSRGNRLANPFSPAAQLDATRKLFMAANRARMPLQSVSVEDESTEPPRLISQPSTSKYDKPLCKRGNNSALHAYVLRFLGVVFGATVVIVVVGSVLQHAATSSRYSHNQQPQQLSSKTSISSSKATVDWPSTLSSTAAVAISCLSLAWQYAATRIPALRSAANTATRDTLVVYIFSPTDSEYEANFRFFLRNGIKEGDGCDYTFIINQVPGYTPTNLPALPTGSRYLFHENACYDWGTVGWAIEHGLIQPERYKHLVVVNSSVRGPFLPAYWPRSVHWTNILTDRLKGDVKLVGPTISCEGCGAAKHRPGRQNPHVQSYVMAMDQIGFQLLQQNGSVFACHDTLQDTVYHSELGSSRVVLDAGYDLDSLMLKYQGVDWRDRKNWDCNMRQSPVKALLYDGISMNPLEALFVKYKGYVKAHDGPEVQMVQRYDEWMTPTVFQNVSRNLYVDQFIQHRLKAAWAVQQHPVSCFDYEYYKRVNKDLPRSWGPEDAFNHFVQWGLWEPRLFRFNCSTLLTYNPTNASKLLLPNFKEWFTPSTPSNATSTPSTTAQNDPTPAKSDTAAASNGGRRVKKGKRAVARYWKRHQRQPNTGLLLGMDSQGGNAGFLFGEADGDGEGVGVKRGHHGVLNLESFPQGASGALQMQVGGKVWHLPDGGAYDGTKESEDALLSAEMGKSKLQA